jgi:uncharacterized protein (DUF983 family)
MTVAARAGRCRCPNCGYPTLFEEGHLFKVREACPGCGLRLQRGAGAFLGPFVINYAFTAFGVVIPVLLLHVHGTLGSGLTLGLCAAGALLVPPFFYRVSWGWWLALYYFFLPDNLPANLDGREKDDE